MTASEFSKIVTFRLGEDLFAADIYAVERVLRYQVPTPIPNVPDWIEGVVEYQGRVVPVLNLRRRFELPTIDVAAETRILVFHANREWVAAIVDAVLEVSALDQASVSPPPELFRGLSAEYLKGIVRRKERLVILLDIARLLSSNDRLALERAVQAPSLPAPAAREAAKHA
ncbi:MAG TPA: chemotaxis protein CheW [Gemmatimonadaceae bacterium]